MMSDDSFTVVSSESWIGRIGRAITGILIGIVLFLASFVLLFWNEDRSIRAYKTYAEAGQSLIPISNAKIDPANSGKLVYVTGKTSTDAILKDPVFGVTANAIQLVRRVEMFQWEENQETQTKKKLGGGTETSTTYRYSKVWSGREIRSTSFKKPDGHENPTQLPFSGETFFADPVMIGAFSLSRALLTQIHHLSPLPLPCPTALPPALAGKPARVTPDGFYIGADPATPQVGDVWIKFQIATPSDVSIIAGQLGTGLTSYKTRAGGTVEMLSLGIQPADAMIQGAESSQSILTWILRAVGYLMMFSGLALVMKPLSVIADVIPFLGGIVETGTNLIAFFVSAVLSLLTIAFAWLYFRPLLSIGLLLAAGAVGYLAVAFASKFRKPKAASDSLPRNL